MVAPRVDDTISRPEASDGSKVETDCSSEKPVGASDARTVYESDDLYKVATICLRERHDSREYTDRLLLTKLDTIRKHRQSGVLVDVCCATGHHLLSVCRTDQQGIGIDFSMPFLAEANANRCKLGSDNIAFLAADARSLPIASGECGTVYSLSALYVIPHVAQVIAEVARVLRPGGRAILDLGNIRSLNSFCVRRYYPELPRSFHITPSEMRSAFERNGLLVVEHRAFQLLPLWAGRPRWLWPLLHPFWKRFLAKRVAGRMLDEWVSSLPVVNWFAFRHLFVCEKVNSS